MVAELAGQGLGQVRDLGPQPSFRQVRERGRVALAAGQGVSINRPDTPLMSEATELSLMPASSSSFSSRWISLARARTTVVRVLVRSRSCRIGSGGTNEPRTSPCAPS